MPGYSAGFSGLFSSGVDGTLDIARRIGGSTHYSHRDWPRVLADIVELHNSGNLPRPLCLFGHSMGAEAVLEISAGLRKLGVEVDYNAIIDLTLGPTTKAGGNIKLLQEFHSQYARTKFDESFSGHHELYELDDIMGKNVGHSEAARLKFTQDKIVSTIAKITNGRKPVEELPAELTAMMAVADKFTNPARETAEQTRFNKAFFNAMRPQFGSITPKAIDGMKTIVHAFDEYIAPKGYGDELLAFVLGNVFNETGKRMWPVRETNASSHAGAMAALDKWWQSGKAAKAGVKSRYWKDGYYGRGLFQETHFGNYSKGSVLWQKWFGFKLDFAAKPDLFLHPLVSSLSAFIGVVEGKYTGRKLSDFTTNGQVDFAQARRMVNGDRNLRLRDVDGDGTIEPMGDEIGAVCETFLKAILSARESITDVDTPIVINPDEPPTNIFIGDVLGYLSEKYPDTKPSERMRASMLADALAFAMRNPPPDKITHELSPNPPIDADLSKTTKGNGMFTNALNFKSKTALTGMFSVLAGLAMFILPEGNMVLELARSIFPQADPGTLVTGGLAIIFARDAISKNGNGS